MARLIRLGMAFRPGLEWRENIRYPIEHVPGFRPLRRLLENDRSLLESGANPEPVLGPRSARTREDLAPLPRRGNYGKISDLPQVLSGLGSPGGPGSSIRLAITRLSGGLISLGDGVRLLHALHAFRPRHQHSCFRRFDGAACGYGKRDCRHAFVVRHIGDDHEIIFTKAIPAANELAPDGLASRTADGFNSVLRVLELRGPRLRGVGCLVHIQRHIQPPLLVARSGSASET